MVGIIEGKDAYQTALRKAKFGHRDWIVWRTREGITRAAQATAESVKIAMLQSGTQGHRVLLGASDGVGMRLQWRIALNVLAQKRMGW